MPGYRIILLIIIMCIFWSPPAESAGEKRAVIVVVDYISLQDLNDPQLTNINRLIKDGGLALMNTNTAGGRVRENSFVTIGAGKVALGGGDAALAFQALEDYQDEPAGELYRRRTGKVVSPESIVHLGIAPMLRANEGKNYTGSPGLLGEELHRSGLKTAVIGNGDVNQLSQRHAAAIVMDRSGLVDGGMIGEELLQGDGENLLLVSTDYEKAAQALAETLETAQVIVVETGDTARLERSRSAALDKVFLQSKRIALKKIDDLVGKVRQAAAKYDTVLMVVTPTPSWQAMNKRNYVTPLLFWKQGSTPGLLISGTTRRQGIVANTDIAPTILSHFGLPVPGEMSGRPMHIVKKTNTLDWLMAQNQRLVFVNQARSPLVKGYVLGQIIVVAAAVISLFTKGRISKFLQPVLLALASVPLTFLILGKVTGQFFPMYILTGLGITFIITVISIAGLFFHNLVPFLIVSLLTAGAILWDLAWGAPLMQNSVLGYDPMGGARYYGLGNEYMGVLIGSVIIGTTSLVQVVGEKKIFLVGSILVFLAALSMIASPSLGANAGGAIAAVSAFGFTAYQMVPVKMSPKQLIFAMGAALVFLAAFAGWDASRAVQAQSHFGRTINLLRTKGISEAYNIMSRKITLNVKLIRWTIWSQVFLVTLLATALLFYRPVGLMKRVRGKYPYLTKGFWGVTVGSLVALVFNDSGIVAAATMSIFAAAPLIFVVIQEKEQSERERKTLIP